MTLKVAKYYFYPIDLVDYSVFGPNNDNNTTKIPMF